MCFIFNPENICREDRNILSTHCSLEYKIFVIFPEKFSRLESSSVSKTKTQISFFKPLDKSLLLLFYPLLATQYNVPRFF